MQKYLDILKNSALFSGIDTKDLINMFKCLLMNIKTYEKNFLYTQSLRTTR